MKRDIYKKMGVIASMCLIWSSSTANAQMVVSDPASVAQRAMNFVDQMSEAIEEKYAMYEQIEQASEQIKMAKKSYDKYRKVMGWVKTSQEIISIITIGEEISKEVNDFRRYLNGSQMLNADEQFRLYLAAFKFYEKAMDHITEAKRYISDFNSEEDTGLSSAERLDLLRNIRQDMQTLQYQIAWVEKDANNRVRYKKEKMQVMRNLGNNIGYRK